MPRLRLLLLVACLFLGGAAAPARASTLAGTLFDTELYSPILAREMTFRVYLPPDYFSNDQRRYPTLYMLHGAGGNYTEWSDSYLPDQIDDMIARGIVQPMIVVMPDGG